ncbi:peroxiredoxin [Cenarchaeum symbiosum A]|uniref:thioredoxin-dependent peroxiredoxin n=1 Tax=Cenarchaeum symbiosum (strain A) TaxID=414004 RepID=A0RU17_CENSY|nr:peroxiredoxin [Cenarchaeum symbiosum A]
MAISEGDKEPKFEAQDSDGKTVKSSDYAGKRHVIYFYPKNFTPGCTIQADEFSVNLAKFKKAGIEIIGVSPDDSASHKKFCNKMGVKYTLLADTDHTVSKGFGVWGTKKFMGKEHMGVIRSTFLVDEKGLVFKVFPKVKPAGHAAEVLDCFKS